MAAELNLDVNRVEAGAPATVLEVERLCVTFPGRSGAHRAVDDVCLRIGQGESVALVGESGSGKSVTSLAVMRLLDPSSAEVRGAIVFRRRDGALVDLSQVPGGEMHAIRGDEIAMIFQEPMTSLNPLHTVGRQIAEMFEIHRGARRPAAMERARELLERVGIPEPGARLHAYPHELSGGMRQRVMIAIAIACAPTLLIADEPTTALDVTIQAQIVEMLRDLRESVGQSMLFVSHDLGVVAEIADRVYVMYAGQVVEAGTVADVLLRPVHPYTRGLIASLPRADRPDDDDRPLHAIPGRVPEPGRLPSGCRFHPRCERARAGDCDRTPPALEPCGPGHEVRCLRWREPSAEGGC